VVVLGVDSNEYEPQNWLVVVGRAVEVTLASVKLQNSPLVLHGHI
jgi:hypothetical protein